MGPKKSHTEKGSWLNTRDYEIDQSSSWLDIYRKHLTWIKSTDEDDDENLVKDLASEM
jgi:hypothetical protein